MNSIFTHSSRNSQYLSICKGFWKIMLLNIWELEGLSDPYSYKQHIIFGSSKEVECLNLRKSTNKTWHNMEILHQLQLGSILFLFYCMPLSCMLILKLSHFYFVISVLIRSYCDWVSSATIYSRWFSIFKEHLFSHAVLS